MIAVIFFLVNFVVAIPMRNQNTIIVRVSLNLFGGKNHWRGNANPNIKNRHLIINANS
jgi:hypothetical protein